MEGANGLGDAFCLGQAGEVDARARVEEFDADHLAVIVVALSIESCAYEREDLAGLEVDVEGVGRAVQGDDRLHPTPLP